MRWCDHRGTSGDGRKPADPGKNGWAASHRRSDKKQRRVLTRRQIGSPSGALLVSIHKVNDLRDSGDGSDGSSGENGKEFLVFELWGLLALLLRQRVTSLASRSGEQGRRSSFWESTFVCN